MSETKPRPGLWKRAAVVWAGVLAFLWLVLVLDWIVPANFVAWGIEPRSVEGLTGIATAPVLHADAAHLAANSLPLFVLGLVSVLRSVPDFVFATVVVVLVSGIGVWLTAPPHTVTVGASGLIFGYFGYLLGRGVFLRSGVDIAVAVGVFVVYGSMIWGVLPSAGPVSWQGHLFGFAGGALAAFLVSRREKRRPQDSPATA
ncbi:rhomboid family intramembrane serine protease [Salininema proteolyticum]|uniref:Rhomboid family intramembrane serine protease n=1 Tax=Salininema proteolyticum TaxID=1607685 RepID=A0ABV8U3C5_9ACTN